MSRSAVPAATLEFDAFSVGIGAAVISGGFSLLEPFLSALTGTLAALAVAAWVARLRRGPVGEWLRGSRPIALAILATGAGLFLAPQPAWATYRGLVLGLALVPLWLAERSAARPLGRTIAGGTSE